MPSEAGDTGRFVAGGAVDHWLVPGGRGRTPALSARGHPVTATPSRASIGAATRPRNTRRCSTGTSVRAIIDSSCSRGMALSMALSAASSSSPMASAARSAPRTAVDETPHPPPLSSAAPRRRAGLFPCRARSRLAARLQWLFAPPLLRVPVRSSKLPGFILCLTASVSNCSDKQQAPAGSRSQLATLNTSRT